MAGKIIDFELSGNIELIRKKLRDIDKCLIGMKTKEVEHIAASLLISLAVDYEMEGGVGVMTYGNKKYRFDWRVKELKVR